MKKTKLLFPILLALLLPSCSPSNPVTDSTSSLSASIETSNSSTTVQDESSLSSTAETPEEIILDNGVSFPEGNLVFSANAEQGIVSSIKIGIDTSRFTAFQLPATSYTITSSNTDILPSEALSFTYSTSNGGYVNGGTMSIDLSLANIGTTYITFSVDSPNTSDKATICKKIEFKEYNTFHYDSWNCTLNITIPSSLYVEGMNVQINDTEYVYGSTNTEYRSIALVADESTIEMEYTIGHRYSVFVYYEAEQITMYNFRNTTSDSGTYEDGFLTFTKEGSIDLVATVD